MLLLLLASQWETILFKISMYEMLLCPKITNESLKNNLDNTTACVPENG